MRCLAALTSLMTATFLATPSMGQPPELLSRQLPRTPTTTNDGHLRTKKGHSLNMAHLAYHRDHWVCRSEQHRGDTRGPSSPGLYRVRRRFPAYGGRGVPPDCQP